MNSIVLLLLTAIPGLLLAQELPVRTYRFDAGPPAAPVATGAAPLTPAQVYAESVGYGWTRDTRWTCCCGASRCTPDLPATAS